MNRSVNGALTAFAILKSKSWISAENPQPAAVRTDRKRADMILKKIKIAAVVVALILVGIVLLQNTESMETRILFMTITMPRALLIASSFLLGGAVGVILAYLLVKKNK